jgi:hypothetical protein
MKADPECPHCDTKTRLMVFNGLSRFICPNLECPARLTSRRTVPAPVQTPSMEERVMLQAPLSRRTVPAPVEGSGRLLEEWWMLPVREGRPPARIRFVDRPFGGVGAWEEVTGRRTI